jgi:serine phosphatase RsbU (regulator of sigma subunit)
LDCFDLLKKFSKETNKDSLFFLYDKISTAYANVNVDKAIEFQKKSLELGKLKNTGANLAYSYNSLGNLYMYKGNLNEAIINLTEGLKILEENNELSKAGLTYGNIGNVYLKLKMYDKALEYYNKGLEIKKKLKEKNITANLYSISNVYRTQGKYKEAVQYLNDALSSIDYSNPKSTKYISSIYTSLGVCYRGLNNYDKSLFFYNKVDSMLSQKDLDQRATLYNNMATLYEYKNEERKALYYQYKSYNISKELNDLESISTCFKNFTVIYSKLNLNDSSRYFFDEYIISADSIQKMQNSEFTQELTTKYETEKKEGQITLLAKDKMLQTLLIQSQEKDIFKKEIENKHREDEILILNKDKVLKETQLNQEILQKKNKEKENQLLQAQNQLSSETIKQHQTITFLTMGVLLITIGFSFFIFKGLKVQKKANGIISKQKEEVNRQKLIVEEHQKEILDSIHYAKRIQTALLANKELLNTNIPNNFVLFKPKDIVSGDFYWATEHNDKFYLAVCDSTGHGVPGAFMSLLNIGFLSEAIKEKNIFRPNEILNYVRKRLIDSIGNEGQRDGMDAIIMCFDKKTNSISYSGANNQPILIRDNQIVILPKDKMPVGKGETIESFTLHNIEAQKNDVLYLYTDGYADQFGGSKGKKFKYKPLNELLLSISKDSMVNQKEILDTRFISWKDILEQVDDVCVIGFTI